MTLFRSTPAIGQPVRQCDAEAIRLEELRARWQRVGELIAIWSTPGAVGLGFGLLAMMAVRVVFR